MASVSCLAHRNTFASDNDDTLALFWLDGMDMDGKYPYPSLARMDNRRWSTYRHLVSYTVTHTQAINSKWQCLCYVFVSVTNNRKPIHVVRNNENKVFLHKKHIHFVYLKKKQYLCASKLTINTIKQPINLLTIKNISYEENLSFFGVGRFYDGFSASV